MTVEQLGIARPDLRNPALAVMTEALTGAENRYSGIPTIRRAMKEYGLPEPKFENRRNEFVVTLFNGGAKYMADADSCDRITYESQNSPFMKGAAEKLVACARELLSHEP